jgi:hypothetical protein
MSTRPIRQSAKEAREKIQEILAWETCSESSEAFKAAAAKMELEFLNAKRRRVVATENKSTLDDEDDDEDDSDFDCESDSDSDDAGSVPSSGDVFSDPGDSSEDDDSIVSETISSAGDAHDSPV